MDRILRGIMRYRVLDRASMVKQFEQVRDNPVVSKTNLNCACRLKVHVNH